MGYTCSMHRTYEKSDFSQEPARKDNIKMGLQEIGCECEDWIELVQHRVQWQVFVNVVTCSLKACNFLTS
jgi:hypothetical protein